MTRGGFSAFMSALNLIEKITFQKDGAITTLSVTYEIFTPVVIKSRPSES
ncbi:MAG: hypothetical protein ACD_47C00615G0001, partial [uncultured bacterium]